LSGGPGCYGCTGCYGCYGGHSGYGVPVPVPEGAVAPVPDESRTKEIKKPEEKGDKVPEQVDPGKGKKEKPVSDQVRVKVRIEIPEGRKLFVDGKRVDVAPGSRVFETPLLTLGRQYFYDFRIDVERRGEILSEERRVIIQSAEDIAVAFPNLAARAALAARTEK
jgi:uncharacterized protein (TIGR03000 family)